MNDPVKFPTTYQQQELLRAQNKRAELIVKRDRLNERIVWLDKFIDGYAASCERQNKFWKEWDEKYGGKE